MPLTDSEPVRLWRDKFKLNLSKSWKADVDKTVTDLVLWRKILNNWKYRDSRGKWKSRAPGIKNLLTEYESREREQLEANERTKNAAPVRACDSAGIPERNPGSLRDLQREAESLYFGGGRVDAIRFP